MIYDEFLDIQETPPMKSLRGVQCPLCGGSKHPGRTFCDVCFIAAGPAVRAMLCVPAVAYPAAFVRAFEVLGKEPKV